MNEQNNINLESNVEPKRRQGAPNAVIILLLIFFFPVGLLLMWLKKSWKLWVKILISVFFLLITVLVITSNGGAENNSSQIVQTEPKEYVDADIDTMINELSENALRAEEKYQNQYVRITGKISNFDSDGKYVSIESEYADEWNFDTIMCYIKSDAQREYLMNKSVGDVVTIEGKVTSIGEILGYSIKIDNVE